MKQAGIGYKQLNHLQANSHKQFIKEEKTGSGHEKRNGKLKIKFFLEEREKKSTCQDLTSKFIKFVF